MCVCPPPFSFSVFGPKLNGSGLQPIIISAPKVLKLVIRVNLVSLRACDPAGDPQHQPYQWGKRDGGRDE